MTDAKMNRIEARYWFIMTHQWKWKWKGRLEYQPYPLFISLSIPVFLIAHFLSQFIFITASLASYVNINCISIFSLNILLYSWNCLKLSYVLNTSLLSCLSSRHTPLSSCLPSLRELSNNRSLDNLDCIGGTGSSLPHWDDDDFSQACSTLGRRSCMGQVSACVDKIDRDWIKSGVYELHKPKYCIPESVSVSLFFFCP